MLFVQPNFSENFKNNFARPYHSERVREVLAKTEFALYYIDGWPLKNAKLRIELKKGANYPVIFESEVFAITDRFGEHLFTAPTLEGLAQKLRKAKRPSS